MPKEFTEKEQAIIDKYRKKLQQQFNKKYKENKNNPPPTNNITSSSYAQFKKENQPEKQNNYEKICNFFEKIIKINPGKAQGKNIQKYIDFAHMQITPEGVSSFALLAPTLIGIPFLIFFFLILQSLAGGIIILLMIVSLIIGLLKLPEIYANSWRLKVSNQMVEALFYIGTYLRNTANLEQAIRFAADRTPKPLASSLKKIIWDAETQKYDSLSEALDSYLEKWKEWNPEFVEAMHLIESSLYENTEAKRIETIDRALRLMLEETYNKMLTYSHTLKGPLTMLYMLGIVLPIMGLTLLPIVTSFLSGSQSPYNSIIYLVLIYNIFFPAVTYFIGKNVLSKRPTGYGTTNLDNYQVEQTEKIMQIGNKTINLTPANIGTIIFAMFFFLGLLPLIIGTIIPTESLLNERGFGPGNLIKLLEYRLSTATQSIIGPYGLLASLVSLLIPLGIGLGLGSYYYIKSNKTNKVRKQTETIEKEFSSHLFQLGNRIGDGIPPELAFEKIATDQKSKTNFFKIVTLNLRNKGMDLNTAIFDKTKGAIKHFPSNMIESSMRILVESAKKGPKIASKAILNISTYIADIQKINERIKDLLSEIISDMKQQVAILAPAIAAVVIGITSMVVTLLNIISDQISSVTSDQVSGIPTGLIDIFGQGLPTYYFQIIVGIYIIQVTYVLTVMINGIENGSDKTSEEYNLGKNLIKSTIIYTIITAICITLFTIVSAGLLGNSLIGAA